MAGKVTIKLPNPEGVAAGGTATFRIPVGRRIHSLYLDYAYDATTQNVADFEEIRIFVNGQVIQRFTGTERDALNQFDGLAASVGILEIPFDRKNLKTMAGQEETALNTGVGDDKGRKISSMYMEIDLNSGMTIAATDLALYAKQSDAVLTVVNAAGEVKKAGPGTIPYIRREQRNPAGAASDFQISDFVNPGVNAADKVALNRITFIPSTGTIANLKIDRNTYNIFDRTDELNRAIQSNGVRTPQSGYYMIDMSENGYGGEPIDLYGMTDFRYRLDVSAAMTLTALSEYFGVLQN
jgi:hypothetical protein